MFNNNMLGQSSVIVESLVFIKVGKYNSPHVRHFNINYGSDEQQILNNMFATNEWLNADPSKISNVLPTLIKPSFQAGSPIPIVNGWDNTKLRFVLTIILKETGSLGKKYIVQGYTDHADLSMNNLIDPRTVMYINSVVTVGMLQVNTPMGMRAVETFENSIQIPRIDNSFNQNNPMLNMNQNYLTLRPVDVFNQEIASTTYMGVDKINIPEGLNGSITNNYNNNIPSSYLGKLIHSYNVAAMSNDISHQDTRSFFSNAASIGREASPLENMFLRFLYNNMAGENSYMSNVSSFTYNDLVNALPAIKNVETFIDNRHAVLDNTNSEYWSTSSLETEAAYIIATSAPAIAINNLIRTIDFIAYNNDINNPGDQVIPTAVNNTFGNVEMGKFINNFINNFKMSIAPHLSKNNYSSYYAVVKLDAYKDINISISINGGPMIPFILPAFCDGITTPVVTNMHNQLFEINSGFNAIINDITDSSGFTSKVKNDSLNYS